MQHEQADVDGIPVRIVRPDSPARGTALWLSHLGGSAEQTVPMLERLAGEGFLAVSFDAPGHGARGQGGWPLARHVLDAFRMRMWPLLGTTTLEALRVLDRVTDAADVAPLVVAGGVSMGGDIAVALAGIDPRISRVSALVATPDWTRPGMRRLDADDLLDQGDADAYARWYYDRLDPMTHRGRYDRDVAIAFESGGNDTHVPVEAALRFQRVLRATGSKAEVEVRIHEGATHLDSGSERFLDAAIGWLTQP